MTITVFTLIPSLQSLGAGEAKAKTANHLKLHESETEFGRRGGDNLK